MQAAVVPAANSAWQIKDVPQPQPGPNQVLVKMHASGICYTDVHLTLGHFPGAFPRILGHEPVGEIVAVAPDVTARKVGAFEFVFRFLIGEPGNETRIYRWSAV
ncbi:MAG: alcohol dehydrogenase catalytic domain-containing protein [Candidatus Acidiferrales bacterium]